MASPGVQNDTVASPERDLADSDRAAKNWFTGRLAFWLPVAPLVALDLWSKAWAFGFLARENGGFSFRNRHQVFDLGWLEFELVTYLNKGTIWGLGESLHVPLKVFRVGAIGAVVYFAYRTPPRARWMLFCLGLILSGALGNLYDNMFHDTEGPGRFAGAVRDFIHFHNLPSWDFPAFNVADSCISVGACLLFLLLWRKPDGAEDAAK